MAIAKRKLAGCLQTIMVLLGLGVLAGVFWIFRKPISSYFFDNTEYGSLIGLMIVVVVPFLGYIFYYVIRHQD
jgi:Na+-driven multidrug efflux pump